MKKAKLNAIVDIMALIAFIFSAVSGFVLWFVLPRGGGKIVESVFVNLFRHQWLQMHNISSLVFTILMILHFLLHVAWFKNIKNILISE